MIWVLAASLITLYTVAWNTYNPARCPECHRAKGHKMDCSHG